MPRPGKMGNAIWDEVWPLMTPGLVNVVDVMPTMTPPVALVSVPQRLLYWTEEPSVRLFCALDGRAKIDSTAMMAMTIRSSIIGKNDFFSFIIFFSVGFDFSLWPSC